MTMQQPIPESLARVVVEHWRAGEPVRERLPGGRLYLDRPLPFLVVHRRPAERRDPATAHLATSGPAYAVVSAAAQHAEPFAGVVGALASAGVERFGAFLVVEVWATVEAGEGETNVPETLRAGFYLRGPETDAASGTVAALARALKRVALHEHPADVEVGCAPDPAPPGLPSLFPGGAPEGVTALSLEVAPVYRERGTGVVYPFLFDGLRTQLHEALQRACFVFAGEQTTLRPAAAPALGRARLGRAAAEVDRGLARLSASFEFLLGVTPTNSAAAWEAFRDGGFREAPRFEYRPLPVDPELVKRELFGLPVERVEDPLLAALFREKQEELDRKVTLLRDRNTRRFYLGSLALYGEVEAPLLALAEELLEHLPERDEDYDDRESLDCYAFAARAREDMDRYRAACAAFPEGADIRPDVAGVLVSQGRLLIGRDMRVPAVRSEALVHHEVGTHMVTYYNGAAQPLQTLGVGLAGYEALQEGLAVLSEYLVGGLTVSRLRVLAGRVVAADCLIEGASFCEVFRLLCDRHRFDARVAFNLAMRTFRGGGLVKDVIYLRGLAELTAYLQRGGSLDDLFVGKLALRHAPVLAALREAGVLRPAPLRPRYLAHPLAETNLERLRGGLTFVDLFNHPADPA